MEKKEVSKMEEKEVKTVQSPLTKAIKRLHVVYSEIDSADEDSIMQIWFNLIDSFFDKHTKIDFKTQGLLFELGDEMLTLQFIPLCQFDGFMTLVQLSKIGESTFHALFFDFRYKQDESVESMVNNQ